MLKINHNNRGFTLIEIMTAVSLFLIVMTISMGSILGVIDANRRAQSTRSVLNSFNLSIERMSREMRYGRLYHCGNLSNITSPQNCLSGSTQISFLSSDGEQIVYQKNGTGISRYVWGDTVAPMTPPEVYIDDLQFYVVGATSGDGSQPKVLVLVKGHSGVDKSLFNFNIQTLISQRLLDS